MIEVIQFRKEDCRKLLREQPSYLSYLNTLITDEIMEQHEKNQFSFSIIRKSDGKPLACAGVHVYWQGRGEAWTIFARELKSELVLVHRAIKRYLEVCPVKRIEAAVDFEHSVSHRWIKSLGFTLESPRLRAFRADGGDVSMYVRIRED